MLFRMGFWAVLFGVTACGPDRAGLVAIPGDDPQLEPRDPGPSSPPEAETPTATGQDPSPDAPGPGTTPTAEPTPPPPSDTDGDGLSDAEELTLGTSPTDPDSDGDGYDDGVEVGSGNTDPMDVDDHPYQGGWPIASCRDQLVATGNQPGQVAYDFALVDQHGERVRLHDFCDRAVLLVSSASWCGPCQQEAGVLQQWFASLEAQGLVVITLLGEGNPASWANTFGLQHPVVSDPGYLTSHRFVSGNLSLPSMHLIGPGARVISTDGFLSRAQVENALPPGN